MGNYMWLFARREGALGHAVEKNVEVGALAFVAVYELQDDDVVVDTETALELGAGDIGRVMVR